MASNHYEQLIADNHALREENATLRRHINGFEGRISALESRDGEQQQWNAEAQKRVNKLQRQNDLPCPGCGQPFSTGQHGVTCFRTVDDS